MQRQWELVRHAEPSAPPRPCESLDPLSTGHRTIGDLGLAGDADRGRPLPNGPLRLRLLEPPRSGSQLFTQNSSPCRAAATSPGWSNPTDAIETPGRMRLAT